MSSTNESYIISYGADPEKDFIDPQISEAMTPEGRKLMKRVLGSTTLRIQIFDTNSLRMHQPKSKE
jgi:hypothetical protein